MTVDGVQRAGSVLLSTVRSLRRLYSSAACSVALVVGDGSVLRFVAADGEGADSIVGVEMSTSTGIAGWVTVSESALAVSDVHRDPRFARDIAESTGYVPRSILAAPVPGQEGACGVIEVLDADGARRGDLGTLSLAASLLGELLDRPLAGTTPDRLDEAVSRVRTLGPSAVRLSAGLLDSVARSWGADE